MNKTLVRLLSYCLGFKRSLTLGLSFLLIASLAEVAGPVLIKYFIDNYLAESRWFIHDIMLFVAIYLGLQGLAAFCSYNQALIFNRIAQSIIKTLRLTAFRAALKLPTSYLDSHQSGHLISTIGNDSETLLQLYVQVIGQSVQKLVLLVGILSAMFFLNWQLALFVLGMVLSTFVIMVIYQRYSMPWSRKARQAVSDLNHQISETLQGIPVIQSFVQEKRFAATFAKTNDTYLNSRLSVLKLNGLLLRPLIDLLYIFTIGSILSWFAIKGNHVIHVGVIYAFVSYMGRMIEPLNELTNQLTQIQQSLIAGERLFALQDQDKEPTGDYVGTIDGHIQFNHVEFKYQPDSSSVLQDINLELTPGKMVALVGHTGSGKSTILHLLTGLYDQYSGSILVGQEELRRWSKTAMRQQLGVIQQDPFIFTGSVVENVRFGREGITDEAIHQALSDVQWFKTIPQEQNQNLILQEGGKNLSAGQRQLLSFARALVTRPQILILDEATANVDSQTEHQLQQAITHIQNNHTWLVVAHRLSTIVDADEIIVLQHGRIIERGTHHELLAQNKHYAMLYQLQQLSVDQDEMVIPVGSEQKEG